MNGGRVQPPEGSERRGAQPEYQQSDIAQQRLSAGGHLPKMSFLEGIVYYVFFGWAWGFAERLKKKELIQQISDKSALPSKNILNAFTIDQLQKIRDVLDTSSGENFLDDVININRRISQIANHKKALEIFKNFDKAQSLLHDRIKEEIAAKIITYFLSQPEKFIDNLTAFINYAVKLENKKPNAFPDSNETFAINLLHRELITKDTLIQDFLKELLFVTTGPDSEEIHQLLISTTNFETLTWRNQPFSLLLEYKHSNKKIIVSIEDPRTNAKSSFVVKNPKELKHKEFSATAAQIDHERWIAAKEFRDNSQKAFARGIYFLSHPNIFQEAPLAIADGQGKVMMPVSDEKKLEEVAITAKQNNGVIDVSFTYNDITYETSYSLKKDETQEELAERIMNDGSLERDLYIAKGHFTRSPVKKISEEKRTPPPNRKMGLRFKKKK